MGDKSTFPHSVSTTKHFVLSKFLILRFDWFSALDTVVRRLELACDGLIIGGKRVLSWWLIWDRTCFRNLFAFLDGFAMGHICLLYMNKSFSPSNMLSHILLELDSTKSDRKIACKLILTLFLSCCDDLLKLFRLASDHIIGLSLVIVELGSWIIVRCNLMP